MKIEGPLTKHAADTVAEELRRVEGYIVKYDRNRSLALSDKIDQMNGQVTHSVLYVPEQVTHWAWVTVGLDRECQAVLDALKAAREQRAA